MLPALTAVANISPLGCFAQTGWAAAGQNRRLAPTLPAHMNPSFPFPRPVRLPSVAKAASALLLALGCACAFAALDEAPSELPAAKVHRTPGTTSAGAGYTDIARTLESGTVVHEFVDATGSVFAVTWSGPFKPDLKTLLGRHFGALAAGARRSTPNGTSDDAVVQSGGHMGAFEGRAWVPSRLPAGFDTREMK